MTCRLVFYFNRPITIFVDIDTWTIRIDLITGCRVHNYDNISFGNFSDFLCSQILFLALRNTCFRPVGVGRLFPSRTVVTFSTVDFFAEMTNIVTWSSSYMPFYTCGLNTAEEIDMAEVEIRTGFAYLDAVTFRAAFVGFSTEQVFLRVANTSHFFYCICRASR